MTTQPADTPDVWSALRKCEMLSEASDASIAWLAHVSTVRQFHKEEPIPAGQTGTREIGIVIRGHVRSVHYDPRGRPLTALISWPSEPVGLMSGLSEDVYSTTFEAGSNCLVVFFSLQSLQRLMRDEPDVMMSVIRELTRKMTQLMTMLNMLASEVPTRVAIYIGQRVEEQAPDTVGPVTIDLGIRRVELAAVLGTVPETLSRAFHLLQGEGLIESEGRRVKVIDREALYERANGIL